MVEISTVEVFPSSSSTTFLRLIWSFSLSFENLKLT
jgi:hypothetical protein